MIIPLLVFESRFQHVDCQWRSEYHEKKLHDHAMIVFSKYVEACGLRPHFYSATKGTIFQHPSFKQIEII